MPLLWRNNWDVAVQLGFVKCPNEFFGCQCDRCLRRHYLIDSSQPFLKKRNLIGHHWSWHYGYRVPFLAVRFFGCACFLVARLGAEGALAATRFVVGAFGFESDGFADSSLATGFAAWVCVSIRSNLASMSSRRISRLVNRSANAAKSCRDDSDSCCNTCSMDFSIASRKGAEIVRELSSMAPVAWA